MWPNHFGNTRETIIAKAFIKNNSRHLQTSISRANGNHELSIGDLFKLQLLIIVVDKIFVFAIC
jgi:hypothetical protein